MSCNTVCLCASYFKENPCLPPQPVEYVDDLRLENQNLKMEKEGKTIYLAGATLNVVCCPGYKLDGPSKITCSMGNWTSVLHALVMLNKTFPEVYLAMNLNIFKLEFEM